MLLTGNCADLPELIERTICLPAVTVVFSNEESTSPAKTYKNRASAVEALFTLPISEIVAFDITTSPSIKVNKKF